MVSKFHFLTVLFGINIIQNPSYGSAFGFIATESNVFMFITLDNMGSGKL